MWCPAEISLLLELYTTPLDGRKIQYSPNFQKQVLDRFLNDGLIDRTDFPKVTEKGEKLIAMWSATPLPVNKWLDPRTLKDDGNDA